MLAQRLDFNSIQKNGLPGFKYTDAKLGVLFTNILPYVFGIAGIVLLVYLIIGGFGFMTSRGDPKSTQIAQSRITNALIGFVIVVFAYTIIQILGQIFGIQGTYFGQIFGVK